MKITRRQLMQIINEAMYDPLHSLRKHVPSKADGEELTPEEEIRLMQYNKLMPKISDPNVADEDLVNLHTLADTITGYKDPRPGMPDDSLVGVREQQRMFGTSVYIPVSYLPAGVKPSYSNLKVVEEEIKILPNLVDDLVKSHAEHKAKGGWPKDVIAATNQILLYIDARIHLISMRGYNARPGSPINVQKYHTGAIGYKATEYNEAMDFMKQFGWFKGKI